MLRDQPPSLIGASLLDQYVVTLDTRNGAAYFDRYHEAPFARASFGFGLSFEDDVKVSLLWNGSPAAAAGLQVGTQLTAVDGEPATTSCDGIRRVMQAVSTSKAIRLEWEGGEATLERGGTLLD
jgi:S1-C subfamily serine protease